MSTDLLVGLAERQHGIVAHHQARDSGVTSGQLHQLRANGLWEPVTDEVLRRRGSPRSLDQSVLAAVLDAGPGAALSHLPAAARWGVRGCSHRPVHVVRQGHPRRTARLATVHTVRRLPGEWLGVLDGIPVVRPELLALQLFAVCREARAERLVETLWSMRLLSGTSISRFLDDLGRRGRNGTAGLRRYLHERGSGYTPAASGLEMRSIQILREAGITMRRQVDSGGEAWTGRVDLSAEECPLIVEIQSERYHSALVDVRGDAARVEQLEADGFVVVQVTDEDVWLRPRVVVERVLEGWRAAQGER